MILNIPTYLPFGFFPLNSKKVTLTGVESETNGFRDLAYQLLRNAPDDPQELEELRAK